VCEVPHLKCLGPKRKRQNRPIKHIKSRNNINYNINATKRAVFPVKTILGRTTSFYPRDATIARYYLSPCVRPSVRHMLVFYRNAERIKFGNLQKYRHFRLCPTFCKPLENFATQSIGTISVLSVGEIILFEHSSDFIKNIHFITVNYL